MHSAQSDRPVYAVTQKRIARISHIEALLGGKVRHGYGSAASCDAIMGWGGKKSGKRAQAMAERTGRPLVLLEDGFIRSVERNAAPLSLVIDDLGIYYDASAPSALERLVKTDISPIDEARARSITQLWRKGRVSKYNGAREFDGDLPHDYVLVADQVHGDISIRAGSADQTSFAAMLDAALAENPSSMVLVKVHPDVLTRRKRGHFDLGQLTASARIRVIGENCHPVRLIEQARKVYAVTSQIGFEALLWGVPVRCFGMPFYAGWGLTEDEIGSPARRTPVSLERLVHAALVAYPVYADPETGERCEVERIIEHVSFQRRMRARFPEDVYAVGFSRWKRPILRRFLAGSTVRFVRNPASVSDSETLVLWGGADARGHKNVLRVEDGFLRSVGLGADFTQPLSWVQDAIGLYYDPSRPSALEHVLAHSKFEADLLARAQKLRALINEAEITKYNIVAEKWTRPLTDKRVILVPGQVETDASIRLGTSDIGTNLELLRAVRETEPDAYIVYKPHPDVMAGLRNGGADGVSVKALADEVVTHANIAQMLPLVDAVHTMTSLVGFEALMRGVAVTCYGQPFYAGWGLTRDMVPVPRRGRKRSLDGLVAGALILYPGYVSRLSGAFTTPENAVRELVAWRKEAGSSLKQPKLRRLILRMVAIFRERSRQLAVRRN